uniref:Secreted protein n=1 Tax=Brugia timori TaxID=42155 RepID=A0A0R3Q8D6_9BILA
LQHFHLVDILCVLQVRIIITLLLSQYGILLQYKYDCILGNAISKPICTSAFSDYSAHNNNGSSRKLCGTVSKWVTIAHQESAYRTVAD